MQPPFNLVFDDVDQLIRQADYLVAAEHDVQAWLLETRLKLRVCGRVLLSAADIFSRGLDGLEGQCYNLVRRQVAMGKGAALLASEIITHCGRTSIRRGLGRRRGGGSYRTRSMAGKDEARTQMREEADGDG